MDGQNNQENQYGQSGGYDQGETYGQGGTYGQGECYGQNGGYGYYGNGNPYNQGPGSKKDGNGFGIASLVLGIISLLTFCACFNWITAILAIIFGIIQIVQYKERGLAIGGIVTAALSLLFSILLYAFVWTGVFAEDSSLYEYYYDSYFDDDYYNDYYDEDDIYYDYDDETHGNEFLDGKCI